MHSIKLLLQRRSVLRGRECMFCFWHKTNVKLRLTEVSIATKQQFGEKIRTVSTKSVHLLVNKYCTSSVKFEKVCDETLDSLAEYFEELVEQAQHLNAADVSYGVSRNVSLLFVRALLILCCYRTVYLLLVLVLHTVPT